MTTSLCCALFADRRTEPFLQRAEDWVVVGLLVGVLLAGAVVVYFVDRWRKRTVNTTEQAGDELTNFRAMYERGEITESEYAKLRQRVAQRVNPPAPVAPPAPAPGQPGNDPPPA